MDVVHEWWMGGAAAALHWIDRCPLAREAGGQVLDRATLEEATLFSPGLIVSNPVLAQQFLTMTDGTAWRGM